MQELLCVIISDNGVPLQDADKRQIMPVAGKFCRFNREERSAKNVA